MTRNNRRRNSEDIELNNLMLKLITLTALCINGTIVFSLIYFKEYNFNLFMYILWGASNVWLVLFIYANCFHKRKRIF